LAGKETKASKWRSPNSSAPALSPNELEVVVRSVCGDSHNEKVIRPDACLPLELVALLSLIQWKKPPAVIARRCELIAQAYRERPSPNELWDADRREIVRLLTQESDRFRRMAKADSPHSTMAGDARLRTVS
jgi:hypothetical protein